MNEDGRECLTRRMKSDLINNSCDIHYQVQQAFDLLTTQSGADERSTNCLKQWWSAAPGDLK